jgi:hypothetical protein
MNMSQITTTDIVIAVVAIVALVVLVLAINAFNRRRTQKLRAQFGPEYDRTVALAGGRTKAEARLAERSERVHKLNIRSLNSVERDAYLKEWGRVQALFVDSPAGAVVEADRLLGDLMTQCGFPVGDFEQRAADVSVDHPIVTQNYRAAHAIALRQASGQATTEDLRRAMIHYRALFDELVAVPRSVDSRPVADAAVVDITDVSSHRRAS